MQTIIGPTFRELFGNIPMYIGSRPSPEFVQYNNALIKASERYGAQERRSPGRAMDSAKSSFIEPVGENKRFSFTPKREPKDYYLSSLDNEEAARQQRALDYTLYGTGYDAEIRRRQTNGNGK